MRKRTKGSRYSIRAGSTRQIRRCTIDRSSPKGRGVGKTPNPTNAVGGIPGPEGKTISATQFNHSASSLAEAATVAASLEETAEQSAAERGPDDNRCS